MGDRPHSGDTRWCNLVKNHSSRAVVVLGIKTHSYGHDCCSWDQLDSWHHYQNLVWSSKHEVHNECIPFWMSISASIIDPRLFDQVTSSKRSGSADAVSVTFSKWWENKATSCTWKKQRNIWRHDHSVIQPRIGIPVYQYSIKLQQSTITVIISTHSCYQPLVLSDLTFDHWGILLKGKCRWHENSCPSPRPQACGVPRGVLFTDNCGSLGHFPTLRTDFKWKWFSLKVLKVEHHMNPNAQPHPGPVLVNLRSI